MLTCSRAWPACLWYATHSSESERINELGKPENNTLWQWQKLSHVRLNDTMKCLEKASYANGRSHEQIYSLLVSNIKDVYQLAMGPRVVVPPQRTEASTCDLYNQPVVLKSRKRPWPSLRTFSHVISLPTVVAFSRSIFFVIAAQSVLEYCPPSSGYTDAATQIALWVNVDA